jgi:hypothetical protein
MADSSCVRHGVIVCIDDLCRGSSRTLCGLEEGIDFGFGFDDDEYDDDYWIDDQGRMVSL